MVLKARKNIFSFEGTPSEKEDKDPVTIAGRSHLFPSRTQKLSSLAPMILGGKLPGKVGRCRFFLFFEFKPAASLLSESTLFSDCTGFAVRMKSVKLGSGLVIWTLPVFFYLNLGFTIREKNWARAASVARLFLFFEFKPAASLRACNQCCAFFCWSTDFQPNMEKNMKKVCNFGWKTMKNKVFYEKIRKKPPILHTFFQKNGQVGGNVNSTRLPSADKRCMSLCPRKVLGNMWFFQAMWYTGECIQCI